MSDTRNRTRLAEPLRDDLAEAFASQQPGSDMLPAVTPRAGGAATDAALAGFVTAQKVAIKRDFPRILTEAKGVAAAAGDRFYYRIPFKSRDRQTGETKTEFVEGPSINAAMAAVSLYGNCSVEALVAKETQEAWVFAARFVDLEKGVTIVRSFQQRKGQNTGMRDGGRQADIVFQIGQSKAMRNVIVAALPLLVSEMHEAAKGSLATKIKARPDDWRSRILDGLDRIPVAITRVERIIGRAAEKWSPADMARIVADMNSVADGMASADDLWPPAPGEAKTGDDDGARTMTESAMAEAASDEPEPEPPAKPAEQPAPAEEPKAEKPAEEPKPEPANDAGPKKREPKQKPATDEPAKDETPATTSLDFD